MEIVTPRAAAETRVVAVDGPGHEGQARRVASAVAREAGLSEDLDAKLAVIVTELATNLGKHARGGCILLRAAAGAEGTGVEVVALDRGPGIADLEAALSDGFSTARTAGTGLGAVRRMATEFDVYSRRPGGTVVLARLRPAARARGRLVVGAICTPIKGEDLPGDAWGVRETAGGCRVMVADGLGHGPLAREAAQTALSAFRTSDPADPPARVIEDCHSALRATRGAAVALGDLDAAAGAIRYSGVGNVAGAVAGDGPTQHLVSLNGTAGLGIVRAREFSYAWTPRSVLVMASDGIQTRWKLGDHPGLAARDPAVIAAVLYRDHARGRDDTTVVVVKEGTA
jgi:anti-sigma regulatory factor (Ser/Thr protein kinase)